MEEKRFFEWNKLKGIIDDFPFNLPCNEGEIWWVFWGENVGAEINGRGDLFLRAAVIVRKSNDENMMMVPISEVFHPKRYAHFFISHPNLSKDSFAVFNQMKPTSNKRLLIRIGEMNKSDFNHLRRRLSNFINPKNNTT